MNNSKKFIISAYMQFCPPWKYIYLQDRYDQKDRGIIMEGILGSELHIRLGILYQYLVWRKHWGKLK